MKARLAALFVGLLFGVGLIVAGMTDPAKVRAFLDVGGRWDPSLAFVMVGAIGVHLAFRRLVLPGKKPLFEPSFDEPRRSKISGKLVLGAAVFGIGWGLGGVCPGPGLVDAGALSPYALIFTLFMALGLYLAPREANDPGLGKAG